MRGVEGGKSLEQVRAELEASSYSACPFASRPISAPAAAKRRTADWIAIEER